MFLERLPADVQTILASGSEDLAVSRLANVADRMLEVQRFQTLSVAQLSVSSLPTPIAHPDDVVPVRDLEQPIFVVIIPISVRRLVDVLLPARSSPSRKIGQPDNRRDRFLWLFRLSSHLLRLRQYDSQTFPCDIRAQIGVVPQTPTDHCFPNPDLHLQAANRSFIPSFVSLPLALRFVDHVLRGLPFVYANIDDLLEVSRNVEEQKDHLALVSDRLDEFGVIINPSKCVLGVPSLEFLGHQVDSEGLRPLPSKVEAVRNFPPPTSKRQLQRFLGMDNFFRRFLPNCADLMLPLTNMLSGPKGPLELTGEALTAFERIKNSLADATLLTHPAPETQLSLMVDASAVAVGAVLQQHLAGSTLPLAFFSKKLLPAETRHSTFGRELLAIYLAVKHFGHFLEGRDFTAFTDHKPLTFALLSHSDKYNPREIAHRDYISKVTTDIRHIDGTNNEVADMLSRPSLSSLQLTHGIDLCAMAAEQQRVGCPGDESVEAVRDFHPPTSKHQLQRFLGMGNFYRRFLPYCADLTLPLTTMLCDPKGPLELTVEALTAFERIKISLADATLFTHPAPKTQLSLIVDASTVAVGAIIQQYLAGSIRPLTFLLKRLFATETCHSTFDRELFAIYLAVKHFRHWLEGRDFIVLTNHKPQTFALRSHFDK
nr:unnamed protein product [Spirometra erinaceieuropaei]